MPLGKMKEEGTTRQMGFRNNQEAVRQEARQKK
ncbi:hypothetical protein PanWU01x14_022190 [Parasponia andersonii]|uniref:Uncharacterized protein n=1 Tax=Parasponia andersonii TaxID=3476 RepID=A0A2P5DX49_PARAD|nr:hypothetical protein PanWU01x14_022190 [Parasponia andersonii]